MKIGIISFWNTTNNYGQVLQCFALQRFLRNLGHDAYHIRYTPRDLNRMERFKLKVRQVVDTFIYGDGFELIKRKLTKGKSKALFVELMKIQNKEDELHPRNFDAFRSKYIKLSDKEYNQFEILKEPPVADCYVAGSDQIWSSPNPIYMMYFGEKSIKRIAYAASMGVVPYNNKANIHKFKKYVKNIDIVTCREDEAVKICKKLGRVDAELVPDPTFILEKEKYQDIAVCPPDKDFLFVYMLGNSCDVDVSQIFEWANNRKIAVKYVTAQGKTDNFPKEYPNVDEFLGLIVNAKYVITNSFHGMAMSIIFNKNFLVIPLSGELSKMNSRINTTLSNFGLTKRIYKDSFDNILENINYTNINHILNNKRDEIKSKFENWFTYH